MLLAALLCSYLSILTQEDGKGRGANFLPHLVDDAHYLMAATNGRHGPKTRTACLTCRTRRVKCGDERPPCHRCLKAGRICDGNGIRLTVTRTTINGPRSCDIECNSCFVCTIHLHRILPKERSQCNYFDPEGLRDAARVSSTIAGFETQRH